MFAYRRKRSLGCEQLEGRFAPSSVLVGGGSRSSFKDAQALETTQAEQAGLYLAASAVVSQSLSVLNVAPITFDQPAAGEAEGESDWDGSGFCGYIEPGEMILEASGEWKLDGETFHYEIWRCTFGPYDTGPTIDVPSVDPISPETPSEQGYDVDAVGSVPSEEQPAGGDDVATADFLPVVDGTPVAGDEVAEPVVADTRLPDASHPEEMPRCGNDFEDRGLYDHVNIDPEYSMEFPSTNGSDEIAFENMLVEPQYEDAEDEVAPVDV